MAGFDDHADQDRSDTALGGLKRGRKLERMAWHHAVVVIGGMGSIAGSILTGLGVGVVEGLTKFVYPEASSVVVFVLMALVLLVRPAGLFGRTR